jgi:hypothetical protein
MVMTNIDAFTMFSGGRGSAGAISGMDDHGIVEGAR